MNPDDLNSDEVSALLASLEKSGAGSGSDRRRHPRTPATQHVTTVVRRAGSAPVHGALRDLSCSGIGLFAPVPLTVDERIDLLIQSRRPLAANCRVATCRLDPDGRYAIGLEFIEIARTNPPVKPAQSAPAPAAPAKEPEPGEHVDAVAARLAAALNS